MTVTGRASSFRRNKRSASQMIVAGLVVLAVVASLVLIFSDSVQLLRVGVVIALWAATLGALAMTKYRRESALDKAKVRDLQTVYELQLEREITARREYESGVEARVRSESNLDVSEISALRAELAMLRGSLEVLFEGKMPIDRVALTADATRVPELRAGVAHSPARTVAPEPAYTTPTSGPTFASPSDEPVTAEVYVVTDPTDAAASPSPRPAGPVTPTPPPAPTPAPTPMPAPRPTVASIPRPRQQAPVAAPWPVVAPTVTVASPPEPTPEPAAQAEPTPEPAAQAEPTPPETGGRRRRADGDEAQPADAAPGAHSRGLSVAEIMANMKNAFPEANGATQGRRRRD